MHAKWPRQGNTTTPTSIHKRWDSGGENNEACRSSQIPFSMRWPMDSGEGVPSSSCRIHSLMWERLEPPLTASGFNVARQSVLFSVSRSLNTSTAAWHVKMMWPLANMKERFSTSLRLCEPVGCTECCKPPLNTDSTPPVARKGRWRVET